MSPQMHSVVLKLSSLTQEKLAEVSVFIDQLQDHSEDGLIRQNLAEASSSAFAGVWDNEADAVYDTL